jgi:hypothetical protein
MNNIHHSILRDAIDATTERANTHGTAEDNFHHTATMWSAYLGIEVSAVDVCQMQVMAKMSRAKMGNPYHPDHYVDQCGYSALAGRIAIQVDYKEISNIVNKAVKEDFSEVIKRFPNLSASTKEGTNEETNQSSDGHNPVPA